jgi:threonine dehydratase
VIPPYDHPHIIAGQGTAALELFEDAGELDFLLVPCGEAAFYRDARWPRRLCPSCKVIGVEPESADDACRSFRTGTLQTVQNPPTIADGARTPSLGKHTFPIVRHSVHDMVTVSDDALKGAMAFFAERMKIVVEPTGALAAAAIFEKIVPVSGARGWGSFSVAATSI